MHTAMTTSPGRPAGPSHPAFSVFNVFSDSYTYGALVYMFLSIFTGTFYFAWAVTGLALSIGLSILVIGIPFALLFIGSVRSIAVVEARLVEGLLGARMPRRPPSQTAAAATAAAKIREAALDRRTWSSILYLMLMLPLGCIYLAMAIVAVFVPITVIGASIYTLMTGDAAAIQLGGQISWLDDAVHTPLGLVIFAVAGVALAFAMLHVVRAVGQLHGRLAAALLVAP